MGEYYTHVSIKFRGGTENTKKFNKLLHVMDKEDVFKNQNVLKNIELDYIIQNALLGKLEDRGENSGFNCRYFPDFNLSLAPMLFASLFPKCSFSMELRWEYSVGGGEYILIADYKNGELFFRSCQTDMVIELLDEETQEQYEDGEIDYDEIVEMLLKERKKVKPLRYLDYEESFYKGDLVSYLELNKEEIKCDFFDVHEEENQSKPDEKSRYEKLLDEIGNKNALTGLLFALSGKSNRSELASFIIALGGEVKNYVTKKTNYVISDDPEWDSTKIKTAKERGVKIINEEQFLDLFNHPSISDAKKKITKEDVEKMLIENGIENKFSANTSSKIIIDNLKIGDECILVWFGEIRDVNDISLDTYYGEINELNDPNLKKVIPLWNQNKITNMVVVENITPIKDSSSNDESISVCFAIKTDAGNDIYI